MVESVRKCQIVKCQIWMLQIMFNDRSIVNTEFGACFYRRTEDYQRLDEQVQSVSVMDT